MLEETPKVLVDAGERTSVAVRPFLHDGGLKLVVVAKVTLDISSQGPAKWLDPEPVISIDTPAQASGFASILRADEVGLGKNACDVTVVGSVVAPGGIAAASLTARVALFRNGATVLDKSIVARGPLDQSRRPSFIASSPLLWEHAFGGDGSGRAAGEQNPVGSVRPRLIDPADPQRPAGFGPIGSLWPTRAGRINAHWLNSLQSGLPELPSSFPWGYFQSAPRDQQVPFLDGDEWILLEGFNAKVPSLRSRLPWLKARSFVVGSSRVTPIALALDTLAIDAERLRASIVYRGIVTFSGSLDDMAIVTRIASGSEPPLPLDSRTVFARARPVELTMPQASLRAKSADEASRSSSSLSQTSMPSSVHASLNAGAPFAIAAPNSEAQYPSSTPPSARSAEGVRRPPSDPQFSAQRSSGVTPPWQEVTQSVAPASGVAKTLALNAADLLGGRFAPMPVSAPEPARIPPPVIAPPRVEPSARLASHPPMEPLEPEAPPHELTPPSRAALAAFELRSAGLSEEHVQRIIRDLQALPA